MSRPGPTGLDVLELSTNIYADSPLNAIGTARGALGLGFAVRLLQIVLNKGYFLFVTDSATEKICNVCKVDAQRFRGLVKSCLKESLFDKEIYKELRVLTSYGIQKRYIQKNRRHPGMVLIRELLLVDEADVKDIKIIGVREGIPGIYGYLEESGAKKQAGPDLGIQIDQILGQMNSSRGFVENFLVLFEEENTSRRITSARKLTILQELLSLKEGVEDKELFNAALQETTIKNIPNLNYVKKMLESYERRRAHNPLFRPGHFIQGGGADEDEDYETDCSGRRLEELG